MTHGNAILPGGARRGPPGAIDRRREMMTPPPASDDGERDVNVRPARPHSVIALFLERDDGARRQTGNAIALYASNIARQS